MDFIREIKSIFATMTVVEYHYQAADLPNHLSTSDFRIAACKEAQVQLQ
jgi:hypothetical protein